MFLGHFGLAFAAKKVAPQVSVGTTILAAEFLDSVWPLLVLCGVEKVQIAPGITRMTPLDFVHYPWSHSLAMAMVWGALFALGYWLIRRRARDAILLGAIVVSHWFLDWPMHRPDLLLYPGEAHGHGLGLWNSMGASLAIETALFAAGIFIYLRSTRPLDRIGTYAFWALVVTLAVSYLGAAFGPPPPSVQALALMSLIGFVMVAWGWWIDRHREPTGR